MVGVKILEVAKINIKIWKFQFEEGGVDVLFVFFLSPLERKRNKERTNENKPIIYLIKEKETSSNAKITKVNSRKKKHTNTTCLVVRSSQM